MQINLRGDFKEDVEKAVAILKQEGSQEIYLFGSLAKDKGNAHSDIDIAVRGIPARKFFSTYSKTARNMEHELDLVDLDHEKSFAQLLEKKAELVRLY